MASGRWALALSATIAAAAAAQPYPLVMPFPLEVKRAPAGFGAQDAFALNAELERLIRRAGADVPDSAQQSQALKELKRQDCDRDDECLKQLAQLSRTLYALYVELDNTLGGNVVATGRVVRSDGVAMGRSKMVSLPRGKGRFLEVARDALAKLLAELQLGQLPAQRTLAVEATQAPKPPAEKAPPPQVEPAPVVTPAPAPAVEQPEGRGGLRQWAWLPGALALAAGATAGGAYGYAASLHQRLATQTWASHAQAASAASLGETLQLMAAVSCGVTAAAAAIFIWFVASPGEPRAGAGGGLAW